MKTVGIIAEYNPFHNGHKFHIEETKKLTGAETVIVVMSGNFVQRGEPALFEKHLRAEAAILGGADLVLELPVVYSVQSAEFFARGAVAILNSLGCIDYLSFGMEHHNLLDIVKIAELLLQNCKEFRTTILGYLKTGSSFPRARQLAVCDFLGSDVASVLEKPNNTLAVEYIKALRITKSNIKPLAVHRTLAQYECGSKYASGFEIRNLIFDSKFDRISAFVPCDTFDLLNSVPLVEAKGRAMLGAMCLTSVMKMSKEGLAKICDVTEGLENRIKKFIFLNDNLEDFVSCVKTKRYTRSRLNRIMINALLEITDDLRILIPKYLKIIAMNDDGKRLIKNMKKLSDVPVITTTRQLKKLRDTSVCEIFKKEVMADFIYRLILK